jgi:hypothetical protein
VLYTSQGWETRMQSCRNIFTAWGFSQQLPKARSTVHIFADCLSPLAHCPTHCKLEEHAGSLNAQGSTVLLAQ